MRTAYKSKAGWLAARAFPTATSRELQLAADWTMLLCVLDDHTERLGDAGEVAAYLQHLLTLFRADIAGSSEDPLAAAVVDLRKRMLDLVAPSEIDRFDDRLEELFAGYVAEARNREAGRIPDIASYVSLREITIGLELMVSLVELLDGFQLASHAREHPTVRKLATRANHIVGWANDLFTYEKEIIQGEVHNLVLVLMNERRLTIAEAVAQAVAFHDDEVRCFVREVEQLPSFGAADAGVQRYVEMLRCWIRGHLDWACETGRYRAFDDPASEPMRGSLAPSAAA